MMFKKALNKMRGKTTFDPAIVIKAEQDYVDVMSAELDRIKRDGPAQVCP